MGHLDQRDQRGFGLIEVMMAAGILVIVLQAFSSLIVRTAQSQSDVVFRERAQVMRDELRLILRDETKCTDTFGGKSINTFNRESLQEVSGVTQVGDSPVDEFSYGSVGIASFEMLVGNDLGPSDYSVGLYVFPESERADRSAPIRVAPVILQVTVNNAGVITACSTGVDTPPPPPPPPTPENSFYAKGGSGKRCVNDNILMACSRHIVPESGGVKPCYSAGNTFSGTLQITYSWFAADGAYFRTCTGSTIFCPDDTYVDALCAEGIE